MHRRAACGDHGGIPTEGDRRRRFNAEGCWSPEFCSDGEASLTYSALLCAQLLTQQFLIHSPAEWRWTVTASVRDGLTGGSQAVESIRGPWSVVRTRAHEMAR
mmetsp:Transcript_43953/g.116194  ORF Transcript_43953/g.116194 Transcript_43953/m.116194 type:complete len:103 (+) Transcript_43953:561-869(+)